MLGIIPASWHSYLPVVFSQAAMINLGTMLRKVKVIWKPISPSQRRATLVEMENSWSAVRGECLVLNGLIAHVYTERGQVVYDWSGGRLEGLTLDAGILFFSLTCVVFPISTKTTPSLNTSLFDFVVPWWTWKLLHTWSLNTGLGRTVPGIQDSIVTTLRFRRRCPERILPAEACITLFGSKLLSGIPSWWLGLESVWSNVFFCPPGLWPQA